VPDQPVEDGRRPLGPPALRAGRAPAPLSGIPKVFVVTGPSGAGKGTLIARILARIPELELAVSATTRERRPSEAHGRDYWFISDAEFDRRLAEGEFLEYVRFPWGQRSGTLRSEIHRIADEGRVPVLELELEGAKTVRDEVAGSYTVFVDAPLEELERRLLERATESMGEIGERVRMARVQKEQADEFHRVVLNDDLERAAEELEEVVRGELARAGRLSRT
jgi:guanylate kinase